MPHVQRQLCRLAVLALCGLRMLAGSTAHAASDALPARDLIQDVVSRSTTPHAYDWRKATWELQLSYGTSEERNNFDNSTYELAAGIPSTGGSQFRIGLRRAYVQGTASSNNVGRTPFKQESQSTRYEVFTGYAFGLVEGRGMTRFSPAVADVENALFLWGGLHYSHPNKTWIPKKSDDPAPLAGQQQTDAKINLELGLRWQIYLPQSFGLSAEAMQVRPLGGGQDLRYWAYFSGGILWSFGAH